MFFYYLDLAIRSLRQRVALTALMIIAISVGIAASMITLTIYRAMTADPIPDKSAQLFTLQIKNWAIPATKYGLVDGLLDQISYIDATTLLRAHAAKYQTATFIMDYTNLTPSNPQLHPFIAKTRAATVDFFTMFEVPFEYGAAWTASADESRAPVAVISHELNDKLFGGTNSVGLTFMLDTQIYRVVGVLKHWKAIPRFYDINFDRFGKTEDVFVPFSTANSVGDGLMWPTGKMQCDKDPGGAMQSLFRRSECVWIQFWVELPTAADQQRYLMFLTNYAQEQQKSGRFNWSPMVKIHNVQQWLDDNHVVVPEVLLSGVVSSGFLLACLLNAMGLMLAKFVTRSSTTAIRRALGASRLAIFSQCLVEAAIVGLAGGLLALLLLFLGLAALRMQLSEKLSTLAQADINDVSIAIVVAILATIAAALYPAWRAMQVAPARLLKAQ